MSKIKHTLIALTLLLASCQPQSYEQCVLKNLEGVNSDLAAKLVADTCRLQFPEPENRFQQFFE